MGYRKVPTIHTLEFEGEYKGLIVRMFSTKFGKVRRMLALLEQEDKNDQVMGEVVDLVVENLVSWNLEEEDGTPVIASREAIDDLEFDLVMEIINTWLERMTGPDEELGKDSQSGVLFPGQPVTMEAL